MTDSDQPRSFDFNTHWNATLDRYVVRVTFGSENEWFELATEDAVYAYADAILCAASAAEYDTAVLRQMQSFFKMSTEDAASMVIEFRKHRPPLLDPFARASAHGQGAKRAIRATGILSMEPGVSAFTGEPFIALFVRGKQVGQWECAVARTHAMNIMQTAQAAKWDTAYLKYMTNVVGVDFPQATAAVHFLAEHRPEQENRPGDE